MEELLNLIVSAEWEMFQKVENEGGRASCQNDPVTFGIMRRSQFACWSEAACASYLRDLEAARAAGRNLLTEKYARMMERTYPDEYAAFKDVLPKIGLHAQAVIEQILQMYHAWLLEFQRDYPAFARRGRPAFAEQDSAFATSSETYLCGELATYSEQTLELLRAHLDVLRTTGRNYVAEIAEQQARAYGYASLADAERRMQAVDAGENHPR